MKLAPECYEFLVDKCNNCENILKDDEFIQLQKYKRHNFTNTYDHSVRVAVGAAIIAEIINADIESAIKVGLIHDMCFVDRHERKNHGGLYAFYHPIEACENAFNKFGLTDVEMKAVKAHMFPLAIRVPSSRIALALTLSDKAIAIYECLYCIKILRYWLSDLGMREIELYRYRGIVRG